MIVALLAVSVGSSASAKAVHGHHAQRAVAKASSRHSAPASQKGTPAKAAGNDSSGGKIDGEGSGVPLPAHDTARSLKPPKLEIVKPDRAVTPHVLVPTQPLARNAIGQTALPAANIKTGLSPAETPKMPPASKPLPPSGSITVSGRSKIDGTSLIRPSLAATVGGPAKPAGGINGTLLRPKRR